MSLYGINLILYDFYARLPKKIINSIANHEKTDFGRAKILMEYSKEDLMMIDNVGEKSADLILKVRKDVKEDYKEAEQIVKENRRWSKGSN